jgi:hypothetical protein
MSVPPGWQNPISATAGQTQLGLDAALLLPSRDELFKERLDFQRGLLRSKQQRLTPIQVTPDGVIWDGHHAVRAAAEGGQTVTVLVIDERIPPAGPTILQLPVR